MPSASGAAQRAAPATHAVEPSKGAAQPGVKPETPMTPGRPALTPAGGAPAAKRAAPPPPRSSVTETPPEGKRTDRTSHRPIPPLPGTGPERLRQWVRAQSDGTPAPPPRTAHRPPMNSRTLVEREPIEDDDDDDRPTRRPPPVAELAKGVLESGRPFEPAHRTAQALDAEQDADDEVTLARAEPDEEVTQARAEPNEEVTRARAEPVSIEPDAYEEEPEPEPLPGETARAADRERDDDELPTLPPTRPDPDDLDDDEPTIVEPFGYFAREAAEAAAARDLVDDRPTDRPADTRPTDRSMRAAAPVAVDAQPSPPPVSAQRGSGARRPPEPPPAPRVGAPREAAAPRDIVPAAIGYPGAPAPAVRVMPTAGATPPSAPPLAGSGSISAVATPNQSGAAAPMVSRAAPSSPPVAPLTSQMFRASQRPPGRTKVTNFAAGIAALVVVAAAGYLGAMSGRPQATTTGSPPAETNTAAKVDPPPPTTTTAAPPQDPPPAPTPTPTAETPPRAREVAPEPRRGSDEESPRPRRATSDEESPRPRRTTSDEESPRPRRATSDEESPRPRRTTSDEESRSRAANDNPRPSRTHAPRPTDEESGGTTAPPETKLPDSNDAPARPTIDQGALRAAFAEGEAKARACLGASSPTGTARFSVTFAPSGEAVGAVVSGSPFANTLEGQCMAGKFRTLHVPPFTGGEVIVRKSINFQ